ncbi:MAG: Ldh family oxidoreductase [Desulfocapsaceae bacterium]
MESVNLSIADALHLSTSALVNSGASDKNAEITALALVRAEIDGQKGHGLSRVPSYAAQVLSGKIHGRASPVLKKVKPGLMRIDANFGFAYPAIQLALPKVSELANKFGIAAVAIYHSHHFGVAGHPCEDLARQGFAAFVYGNTPAAMAPFGAKEKAIGTNPIAFAAPHDDNPVVIDFALSSVARGKIMAAKQANQNIPEGWALGPDGEPTTDPETALRGSVIPVGGAKGAALALMVEIMSGCLGGMALGFDASSLFEGDGSPPNLSQVILAIDTGALSEGGFAARITELANVYAQIEGARFPGQKRLQNRKYSEKHGLYVPVGLVNEIKQRAS